MGGRMKVDFDALDGAAINIKNAAVEIENQLTALENKVRAALGDWKGDASGAFEIAQTSWDGAMNDMKDILNDISHTVGLSNQEYRDAEANNAKRFQV